MCLGADPRAPDIVSAVKGGAYQFLQKPFARAQLISSIKDAIAEQKQKLASLTPENKKLGTKKLADLILLYRDILTTRETTS